MTPSNPSRRQFLLSGALAVGGLQAAGSGAGSPLHAQAADPFLLSRHVTNVDGDLRLGPEDEALVRASLFRERGFSLRPEPGFDHRADVLGQGVITPAALESLSHTIRTVSGPLSPGNRRPITVAWHYGWYNRLNRVPGTQTVSFKGGDYQSWDAEVETLFNDQKNEFGISVDALSWIPVRANRSIEQNYLRGFLTAANQASRHTALLYESQLALPVREKRIDFLDQTTQVLLRQDFDAMARFWVRVRYESDARIFRLDGRPVVFIFGSHSWGTEPLTQAEATAFESAVDHARESFRAVFGQFPYVVGEEMLFSSRGTFAADRMLRSRSFDAIYIYHHASNFKPTALSGIDGTLFVTDIYIENQLTLLRATYDALQDLRNRYTGKRVLMIPNVAPGFAKPGLPSLMIDRAQYPEFMKLIQQFHDTSYIAPEWSSALGTAELPAPVYVVGSWNKEFEGHAVFPFRFNRSLSSVAQRGFDLVMAIKGAFGWEPLRAASHSPLTGIVPWTGSGRPH